MDRDPVIAAALAMSANYPPRGLLASLRPLTTPPEELLHRVVGLSRKLEELVALDGDDETETPQR